MSISICAQSGALARIRSQRKIGWRSQTNSHGTVERSLFLLLELKKNLSIPTWNASTTQAPVAILTTSLRFLRSLLKRKITIRQSVTGLNSSKLNTPVAVSAEKISSPGRGLMLQAESSKLAMPILRTTSNLDLSPLWSWQSSQESSSSSPLWFSTSSGLDSANDLSLIGVI